MSRYCTVRTVHLAEEPEVAKVFSASERTIYINLDARKGANIVVIIPEEWRES